MMISKTAIKLAAAVECREQPSTSIDIAACIIDLSEEVAEPDPVLGIGDIPVFSRGNISVIGGAAKSRKTFLVCHLAGMFLEGNASGTIVILDTEMARFHTMRTARRIHRIAGFDTNKNNSRLVVLSLREQSTEERTDVLKQVFAIWKPALVFVDGIRDLVKDFNSPDESSRMINLLMRLSSQYNCHICSVLHENKIGGQLRGHLGTEVVNKSETVIGVSVSDGISTVKPLFCRNRPFDEFHFTINVEGLPELCDEPVKPAKHPKADKLKALFASVVPSASSISYSDLKQSIVDKIRGFGGYGRAKDKGSYGTEGYPQE
ncbi:hypothetical protein Barb4_02091 [Bacteroidales bacterium Barb4]|nr:hypothetical protein Barb4_02091 [Bacteroidales bacterium Barb4]